MFQINDVIVYGAQGVCRITNIEQKRIGGVNKNYFVLEPFDSNGPTIYAPTDNEHVLKRMRRLLTKAQIHRLIDETSGEHLEWISNDNERKEYYRRTLSAGDHAELIKMIRAIHAHKIEREAEGKRLHMTDANFMKDAEQMLHNEFQYVLQMKSKDELMEYILARLENTRTQK